MANQFSRPDVYNDLRYSPESFKDMSVAPLAMRERHDKALQFQDDLLFQMQNIKVADDPAIQEEFARRKAGIEDNINKLTNRINTSGAGSSVIMGDLRGLKRDYNKEVSATGFTGKAAGIRAQMEKEKELFMHANSAQKQNPITGEKNWNIAKQSYMDNISVEDLMDESKGVSDFKPTYAPEYVDLLEKAKGLGSIVGSISKENPIESSFEWVSNGVGGVMMKLKQGLKMNESNRTGLEQINNFIKQEIGDSNSKVMQHLRYVNPGVEDEQLVKDYLSSMSPLIQAQIKDSDVLRENISFQNAGGGSGPKGSDPKEPEQSTATLVDTPTGAEVVKNLGVANILSGSRISEIELAEENGTVTPEQINEKKLLIQTRYLVQQQVNDPANKKAINEKLAKNSTLTKDGVPSKIEGYNSEIDILNSRLSQLENSKTIKEIKRRQGLGDNSAGPDTSPETLKNIDKDYKEYVEKNNLRKRLVNTLEDAMDGIVSPEALKYSKLYNVTGLKDGNDLNAETVKDLNYRLPSMLTLAANSGATFTVDGSAGNRLDFNNNRDEFEEMRTNITNGGGKIDTFDIVDMGSTGASQLVMHYSFDKKDGTGNKGGMIAINFDDKIASDSSLMSFMKGLQGRLDPSGQAVIQTILDNKATAGLSIDNTDFQKTGMSKSQSSKVKELSNAFSSGLEQNYLPYRQANYINTKPGNEELYNVVQDQEGYNSMYISKSGKKEEAVPLAAGTWLNREFAKQYLTKNPSKSKTNSYTDISKADDEQSIREFVSWGKDFAETQTAPGGVIRLGIPGNNSTYETMRKEYVNELQKATSLTSQKALTNEYLERIKSLRISTRNKKRLL